MTGQVLRRIFARPAGVGRGGTVVASTIAGFLFAAGYSLPPVAITLALGPLPAALVLRRLRIDEDADLDNRLGARDS